MRNSAHVIAYVGLAMGALAFSIASCATPKPTSAPSIVLVASASSKGISAKPPMALTAWKIGVYLPLSGEDAEFGLSTKKGIDLAISRANDIREETDRAIEAVYADDESTPPSTTRAVTALLEDTRIVALLGEVTSSRTKVGAMIANRVGAPMITPSATHPAITELGPFVFRTCFIDPLQAKATAALLVTGQKKQRIAMTFSPRDPYSSALADAFRDEVKRLGGHIVLDVPKAAGETDNAKLMAEIQRASPDAVYLPLYYPDVIALARQAKGAGIPSALFVGGDGWDSPELLRQAGAELEGAVFANHWALDAPIAETAAFVTRYQTRYHEAPSTVSALGYDAASVLASALRRTHSDDRVAVRDSIAATKSYPGATGQLSFDASRNPDKPVFFVQIRQGKYSYLTMVRASSSRGDDRLVHHDDTSIVRGEYFDPSAER